VTQLTRRSFLQRTPVSAAAFGLLPALPVLAGIRRSPVAAAAQSPASSAEAMIVHVNNVATGEMTLLVGTRAIKFRDPRMVACFIEATREGGRA
jgi:hypothetical protein